MGEYLLICTESNQYTFNLLPPKRRWVIGRSNDCDIVINDSHVSRYHCTLLKLYDTNTNDFAYKLIDGLPGKSQLSKYGLWLKDKKFKIILLQHGDLVNISSKTFIQFINEVETEDVDHITTKF